MKCAFFWLNLWVCDLGIKYLAQVKTLCCIPTATESISIFSNVLNSLRQRANDFAHEMLPLCILQLFNHHFSFITNCNTGKSETRLSKVSFLPKMVVYMKRSDFCGLCSNFTLCRLLSPNKRGIGVIFWHFFRGWFSTWLLVVPTHCEIHSWMATIWQFPFHSVMEKGSTRKWPPWRLLWFLASPNHH